MVIRVPFELSSDRLGAVLTVIGRCFDDWAVRRAGSVHDDRLQCNHRNPRDLSPGEAERVESVKAI